MAEYSGEKELLGTGVAPEPHRRTGGAMPPGSDAAKDVAKAYDEAADERAKAEKAIDPANRAPAEPTATVADDAAHAPAKKK